MKFCLNKATVIGGDKRQAYLAEILEKEGYEVVTYAVNCVHGSKAASLKEALKDAAVIAAPVPFLMYHLLSGTKVPVSLFHHPQLQCESCNHLLFHHIIKRGKMQGEGEREKQARQNYE